MTQEEIQIIIDSDFPSYEKSRLILKLIDKKNENVKIFQEGGSVNITLTDILNSNISDSAKLEIIKTFAEGGEMNEKHSEPDAIVIVGDRLYKVCIADTPEKRKEGLSKCKSLPEDGGMLFVFEEPSTTYFTMAETSIDLDIIFIDEEGEVIEVHSVKANDSEPVECSEEYCYVLEVNYGSGITEGDEINLQNIDDDSDLDEDYTDEEKESISRSKMLVLNSNGDVLMKLVGGERIVSMIKTRLLIKAALKAYKSDNDSDYRRVGKLILTELNEQDSRDPLYVSKPE